MTEKRNYQRIDFQAEADITIHEQLFRCDLVDLALKGALLRSEQPLPLETGEQAQVTVFLPESSINLNFNAQLIHSSGNRYGFAFLSEDSETLGHLRRLLELNIGRPEQTAREFAHWLQQGVNG